MKDRIRQLRKSLNMTQQKFAKAIGVKQNTVAQYEMGRNVPVDSVINWICREFNVNEEWLRTGAGDMFLSLSKEEEVAKFVGDALRTDNKFIINAFSALGKLSPEDWDVVKKFVRMLKDGLDDDDT